MCLTACECLHVRQEVKKLVWFTMCVLEKQNRFHDNRRCGFRRIARAGKCKPAEFQFLRFRNAEEVLSVFAYFPAGAFMREQSAPILSISVCEGFLCPV